jgi:hypothetical protein
MGLKKEEMDGEERVDHGQKKNGIQKFLISCPSTC